MTVLSMTGYGSGSAQLSADGSLDDLKLDAANDRPESVSVVARSVNHRFLDVVFRLPPELKGLEQDLRAIVKSTLVRGRVEVAVDVGSGGGLGEVQLDLVAARQLKRLADELEGAAVTTGELRPVDVLRFPGVLDSNGRSDPAPDLVSAIQAALREALLELRAARKLEGAGIERNLGEILADLKLCSAKIVELSEAHRGDMVNRYQRRLLALLDTATNPAIATPAEQGDPLIDQTRLLQEAGILAERIDIAEETERFGVHLETVESVLGEEGPCGKRLDFLAQELLREVNTMASKCRNAEIATATVDAKVLCERLREQVQNVE